MGVNQQIYTKAIQAVNNNLKSSLSTLLSVPNHIGFEEIGIYYFFKYEMKTLIIVESEELYRYFLEKIEKINNAKSFNVDRKFNVDTDRLVLSTLKVFDSHFFKNKMLQTRYFDIAIIFEASHFVTNKNSDLMQYVRTISKKQLGINDVPYRNDKVSLKEYFGKLSYVYSIEDAIKNGYLDPYRYKKVEIESNINQDLIINVKNQILEEKKQSVIIYLPNIQACKDIDIEFKKYGLKSAYINSSMNTDNKNKIEKLFIGKKINILLNFGYIINRSNYNFIDCVYFARKIYSFEILYKIINSVLLNNPNRNFVEIIDYFGSFDQMKDIDLLEVFNSENVHAADKNKVLVCEKKKLKERDVNGDNEENVYDELAIELSKNNISDLMITIKDRLYIKIGFDNKIIQVIPLSSKNVDQFFVNVYIYGKKGIKLISDNPIKKENNFYTYSDIEKCIELYSENSDIDIEKMLDSEPTENQLNIIKEYLKVNIIDENIYSNICNKYQASVVLGYCFFIASKEKINIDISKYSNKKEYYKLSKDGMFSNNIRDFNELFQRFNEKNLYIDSKFYYVLVSEASKELSKIDNDISNININMKGKDRHIGNFKYKFSEDQENIDFFIYSLEQYIGAKLESKKPNINSGDSK